MSDTLIKIVDFDANRLVPTADGWQSGSNNSFFIEFKYNIGTDEKPKYVTPSFKFPELTTSTKGIYCENKTFGTTVQTYYSALVHFNRDNEEHMLAINKLKELHSRICDILVDYCDKLGVITKIGKKTKSREDILAEISGDNILPLKKLIYIPTKVVKRDGEEEEEEDLEKSPSMFISFKNIARNKKGLETVSMLTTLNGDKVEFHKLLDIKMDFIPVIGYSRFTKVGKNVLNSVCFSALVTKFYEKENNNFLDATREAVVSKLTDEEIENEMAKYRKFLESKRANCATDDKPQSPKRKVPQADDDEPGWVNPVEMSKLSNPTETNKSFADEPPSLED